MDLEEVQYMVQNHNYNPMELELLEAKNISFLAHHHIVFERAFALGARFYKNRNVFAL